MNNKIIIIGVVILTVGFISAFCCLGLSTPWPCVLSIIISIIIGMPIIIIGASVKPTTVKDKRGNKQTITQYNENKLYGAGFKISKRSKFAVSFFNEKKYSALYIDDVNKKWAVCFMDSTSFKIYKYADLNSFELIEDGDSKVQGRAGSALVGSAFFGVVGAIAGAARAKKVNQVCNLLQIQISVNDLNNPSIVISLNSSSIDKTSSVYEGLINTARSLVSNLQYICSQAKSAVGKEMGEVKREPKVQAADIADEIRKFKALSDEGIITQEEFEKKKKQLLDRKE